VLRNVGKVLFFGDLAPEYMAGTSISAKMVLDALDGKFHIIHIPENDDWSTHARTSVRKYIKAIKDCGKMAFVSFRLKPNVFYMHLPSSPGGIVKTLFLVIATRLVGRSRIIMHIHRGDYSERHSSSAIIRWATVLIDRLCSKIFVLSTQHFDSLKDKFRNAELVILENTIENEEKGPSTNHGDKIVFLYLSNYILQKGVLDLLIAFEAVKDKDENVVLKLYGNSFDESFTNQLRAYHDDKQIVLGGPISGTEKFAQIQSADCLILPSWNEGQPLAILEAMAMGTPVIATDVGFIRETVGENYPYLVPPRNPDELSTAIINFIQRPRRYSLGEKLEQRYRKNYSRERHRRKVLESFTELCNS